MRKAIHFQHYSAPCGEITLASIGDELCLCDWRESPRAERNRRRLIRHLDAALTEATSEVLESAKRQLDEYFAGVRKTFDLKTHPVGTAFQQQVWRAQEPWHKPLAPTASASSFPAIASSGPTIP